MANRGKKTEKQEGKTTLNKKQNSNPEPQATETLWFGLKPWIVIVACLILLILLFAPLFSATKIVEHKKTIMTTETTQRPETVTVEKKIKVYVGWLKMTETEISSAPRFYYVPGPPIPYYQTPAEGGGFGATQQQQTQVYIPYNPYYPYSATQTTTTHTIDVSDEIVDVKYVSKPSGKWDITLISREGDEQILRDVYEYDITKTGDILAEVTESQMRTITNQVPKEVTEKVPVIVRVNLVKLIFGGY